MALVEKIGDVFDVNTTTTGVQFTPAVSALRNGGFVVAWDFVGSSIVGQLYDDQGFRSGGEIVLSTTNANSQFAPDIATLTDGTFVVTWAHEFSATDIDIRARRFTETGVGFGNDFGVATTGTFDETLPSITAQFNGRYLVTWSQDDNNVNFIQENADGSVVSGPGPIDAAAPAAPEGRSSVCALVDGTYVVAFEQGDSIFQRRLVGGAVATQVENPGFGANDRPSIAALEGGGYVAVWRQGGSPNDSARPFVSGQIYDAFGNKVGGGFNPVVLAGAVDQTTPVVKGLIGGGFIVVWDDANLGLRALAYDKNGSTVGGLIQLTPSGAGGSLGNIDLTVKMDGDVVVVWGGSDADGVGIQGQTLRILNTVTGNAANNVLIGAASNLLAGAEASDSLAGLGGDDILIGGGGAQDILDGGTGNDTASYQTAIAPVTADLQIPAFNNGVAIGDSYISIENLIGSAAAIGDQLLGNGGANRIQGLDGDDQINGRASDDTLEGGSGNDFIEGESGADFLDGGTGNDSLDGGAGIDEMRGGVGNDTYFVDNVADKVIENNPLEGADIIRTVISFTLPDTIEFLTLLTAGGAINGTGSNNSELIQGNDSTNVIKNLGGNDTSNGAGGNDSLEGGTGNDALFGDEGADRLDGGAGADQMKGGDDNDTYFVDNMGDIVDEAATTGIDKVNSSVGVNLSNADRVLGDVENLALTGSADINGTGNALANAISGNVGNNTLNGASGDDSLNGEAGNDKLIGGAGDDTMNGADGADLAIGGSGADRLRGGLGADIFRLEKLAESTVAVAGRDTILDFSGVQSDKIDLQAIDARTNIAGNQAFTFIGAAAFSGVSGQLRREAVSGSMIVSGDVNGDAVADFSVVLANTTSLQASNFIL